MSFRPVLLLAAVAVTVAFSACTREYTCQCKISYSGQPGLPADSTLSYPVRDTKSKAKSICEGNSTTADQNGIHTVEACSLY